ESFQKRIQLVIFSSSPTVDTGSLCMARLGVVELGAVTTSSRPLLKVGGRKSRSNSDSPRNRGSADWSRSGTSGLNSLLLCLETVDLLDEISRSRGGL